MDKTGRNGLRIGDIESSEFSIRYEQLKNKHLELLRNMNYNPGNEDNETPFLKAIEYIKELNFVDSEHLINQKISEGTKILAEGAQGSLLDIDFGSYPFVTSSNTITAGACTGLGIAPTHIGKVFGIFKAYCTRVGSGPFPTELNDETGERLRKQGNEFGSTTGRPRRCGWLDLPALKYAIMINGVSDLIMMKPDVLSGFDEIKVCTHYEIQKRKIDFMPYDIVNESVVPVYKTLPGWKTDLTGIHSEKDLPKSLNDYITYLEKELNVPISIVSVGPDRKQTVFRNKAVAAMM
jgi:adenylosuccinate synthase